MRFIHPLEVFALPSFLSIYLSYLILEMSNVSGSCFSFSSSINHLLARSSSVEFVLYAM